MSIFKFFNRNKTQEEESRLLPATAPASAQTVPEAPATAEGSRPAVSPVEEETAPVSTLSAIQRSCDNAVANAKSILDIDLDYSDDSVSALQLLINHYRALFQTTPDSPIKDNIVMMLGCYLGETLRRNHLPNGYWDESAPLPTLVSGDLKFGPLKEIETLFSGTFYHVLARYIDMRDLATGKVVMPSFSRGQWVNRTYQNSFLNLTFTLPNKWVAASEEKLAQSMPDSYIMWRRGGPELSHAVLLMAAPMEKLGLPVGSTALNYLAKLRAQLTAGGASYGFSQPFQMPIGNQYYSVLPCLRDGKDLQLYAARTLHNHVSVIMFTMPEKDKGLFPVLTKQFAPLAPENRPAK